MITYQIEMKYYYGLGRFKFRIYRNDEYICEESSLDDAKATIELLQKVDAFNESLKKVGCQKL